MTLMWRAVRRLDDDERGITLLELSIAMVITSMIAATMIVWTMGVVGTDDRHRNTDLALEDLRAIGDRLARDLRNAEYLTVAEDSTLTFWLDGNRDGIVDSGETVTWSIGSDGTMTRSTDADESAVLATLLSDASSFGYDASDPAAVSQVTLDLVAEIASGGGLEQLEYATDVYLRNFGTTSGGSGSTTTTVPGSTTTTTVGGVELVVYKLKLTLDEDDEESVGKVTVKDENGDKIEGVTVHVRWSVDPSESGYPFTDSGVTDNRGEVELVLLDSFEDDTEITFCVTDLVLSGHYYDSGDECENKEWDD